MIQEEAKVNDHGEGCLYYPSSNDSLNRMRLSKYSQLETLRIESNLVINPVCAVIQWGRPSEVGGQSEIVQPMQPIVSLSHLF